jgi:hypothetical protein
MIIPFIGSMLLVLLFFANTITNVFVAFILLLLHDDQLLERPCSLPSRRRSTDCSLHVLPLGIISDPPLVKLQ